ncbi:hypothetical protein A0H81_12608 [Grifola frondosa]|uniref:DUF7918 domain-containing protein n=1 Tax=Grifola frondosa TaxID=5627 RepID=A0A1C7LSI7_GRIFR|nr:hypothetical protein A0H81_12608 [Grifola frondosa]
MQVEGGENTVACYIPSASGKKFEIEWQDHVGLCHAEIQVRIDGQYVNGAVCRPLGRGSKTGVQTSLNVRRPFVFSNLETSDDDSLATKHASEDLGAIEVCIIRIKSNTIPVGFTPCSFSDMGTVHESSKKVGVHCVSLGECIEDGDDIQRVKTEPLFTSENFYVKFLFRYRPADLLKAQGIMPSERPINGLEAPIDKGKKRAMSVTDQNRRLRQRTSPDDVKPAVIIIDEDEDLNSLEEQLKVIQQKIQMKRNGESSSQSVKKERPASFIRLKHVDDNVIDLTLSANHANLLLEPHIHFISSQSCVLH